MRPLVDEATLLHEHMPDLSKIPSSLKPGGDMGKGPIHMEMGHTTLSTRKM